METLQNEINKILFNVKDGCVNYYAVVINLNNLFNKKYFDNIIIMNIADLCNINIEPTRQKLYVAMHCTNWATMTAQFRNILIAMVLDDFKSVLSYCPKNQINLI